MKYALTLKYISLEGVEHAIDVMPADTIEQRTQSLKIMQENVDFVGFLTDEQIAQIEAVLTEVSTATESIELPITAENYPLFIIASSSTSPNTALQDTEALQLGESFAEINTEAFNEATMCDGGPSRKETLRHAREAFRQIGSISETVSALPTILENLESRIVALEGTTVPQTVTLVPKTEETPATEALTEVPALEVSDATESVTPNADVPSEEADTPIAAVVVESPLDEEGNAPASQIANEEEPETAAVSETDPEGTEPLVLSGASRSSLRRLSNGRKNAGVIL